MAHLGSIVFLILAVLRRTGRRDPTCRKIPARLTPRVRIQPDRCVVFSPLLRLRNGSSHERSLGLV
jgi:hypothetical protein